MCWILVCCVAVLACFKSKLAFVFVEGRCFYASFGLYGWI